MNTNNFTILTKSQATGEGDNHTGQLDVLKKIGAAAAITDFALLSDIFVGGIDSIKII